MTLPQTIQQTHAQRLLCQSVAWSICLSVYEYLPPAQVFGCYSQHTHLNIFFLNSLSACACKYSCMFKEPACPRCLYVFTLHLLLNQPQRSVPTWGCFLIFHTTLHITVENILFLNKFSYFAVKRQAKMAQTTQKRCAHTHLHCICLYTNTCKQTRFVTCRYVRSRRVG